MKHLIVGIDGTWRAAYRDAFHSNVFRLNLALEYRDLKDQPQLFIYSGGLGTLGVASLITGGIFADGLDENILQTYINICSNYEPGDKIYLFGFSRGAVAARALCGFITYSGLLKAESSWLVELAWRYFIRTGSDKEIAWYREEKASHTHSDVGIEFLGVWDTVSGPFRATELFERFRFQNLIMDKSVRHGIHVVAIDDTRKYFTPLLWTGKSESRQTSEQIWMPGVHSDIGGGYRYSFFSNLSLLAMLDKIEEHCPDLALDQKYVQEKVLMIMKEDEIIINDEWGYKLSSFLSSRRPRLAGNGNAIDSVHPITEMVRSKYFKVRKALNYYVPSFELRPGTPLQEAKFSPTSWYSRHVRDIVESKLKSLPSRP
jgi:uncharacterized protein (DUF2235 family)